MNEVGVTKMKSELTTRTNDKKEIVNFGLVDNRNREIGAEIITYEAIFTELPETACAWRSQDPGHYYGLRFWATRNGKTFGAIQPNQFFETVDERNDAIAKYLTSAKRRAGGKASVEVEITDSGICKYESALHGCLNSQIGDCMCYTPKTCEGFTRLIEG